MNAGNAEDLTESRNLMRNFLQIYYMRALAFVP